MLALEVLQTCPTQQKKLITTLRDMDPEYNNIITLKIEDFKSRLSHQLDFQITTQIAGMNIHRIVLDEGSSNSVH